MEYNLEVIRKITKCEDVTILSYPHRPEISVSMVKDGIPQIVHISMEDYNRGLILISQ